MQAPEDARTEWDQRYSESDQLWSGHVNPQLMTEAATLRPSTALDVGCGEGGDALWLAEQGWQVSGVDVSGVALERAQRRAAQLGLSARTHWLRDDLTGWTPTGTYDLVCASFLHSVGVAWTGLLRGVPDAVAPGGTLLIFGHDPADVAERFEDASRMVWRPDELPSALGLAEPEWRIEVSAVRERAGTHAGVNGHHRDTVFRAQRAGRAG